MGEGPRACTPPLLRDWAPAFLRLSWLICYVVSITWSCFQTQGGLQ